MSGRGGGNRFRETAALVLASGAVLATGLYCIVNRYEPAISASVMRSELFYAQTSANERALRQAVRLKSIERTAMADIAKMANGSSQAASSATFITLLYQSAQAFGTPVESIDPTPQTAETRGALIDEPLTIRLQGSFRRLLGFVSSLPHHHVPVRILDTQFSLSGTKQSKKSEPLLDATVHVRLYRINAHLPGALKT